MFGIDSWVGVVVLIVVAFIILIVLASIAFFFLVRFGMKQVKRSSEQQFPRTKRKY